MISKEKFRSCITAVLTVLLTISLVSCSTEERKIREALKVSVPEDIRKEYKFKEYKIIETILKENIQDSISKARAVVESYNKSKEVYKNLIGDYDRQIEKCRQQRASTLYYLRGTYDLLIDDYEDLKDDAEEKLDEMNKEIESSKSKIERWNKCIEENESPILFYLVRHTYMLRGAIKEKIEILDSEYKLVDEI